MFSSSSSRGTRRDGSAAACGAVVLVSAIALPAPVAWGAPPAPPAPPAAATPPVSAAPPTSAGLGEVGARAQALRAEATKLYKQKKYPAACALFKEAAAAAPEDAALLTDLALCQHKLGQDEEATTTNLRAIEIASRDAKLIDDPTAARVRRHAYFNLDQMGVASTPQIADDSKCARCVALKSPPSCAQGLIAVSCGGDSPQDRKTRTRIDEYHFVSGFGAHP